ncbi:MAG: BBP7 family outer membrane beta-barrel protein [Pirellulales bacterium]
MLSPPATADGAWVSDEQPANAPAEMFDAQELTGMSGYSKYDYAASDAGVSDYGATDYGDSDVSVSDTGESCPIDGCPTDDCPEFCGDAHGPGFLARCCAGWGIDLWDDVHRHDRVYVTAEYLSMWAQGNPLPPLVTTSPLGTPQAQAGVLPVSATTSILYGNERVDLDQRNGGRITAGYWLVDGQFLGVEGQYFALGTQNSNFFAESIFSADPDATILARPIIVTPPNGTDDEQSVLLAYPGFQFGGATTDLDGSINVRTVSNIQSASMTFRRLVWIDFTMQRRLDFLFGYRFFRLDDSVTIDDTTVFNAAGVFPTTTTISQDLFRSRNQFNGGEIGLKYQSYHGPVIFEFNGKCAFGNNRERTWIDGSSSQTANGMTTDFDHGLLALGTNIGSYRRDVFAILPEANANLKIEVTKNLRLIMGYTFIYTNRVQRSGDAINRTINTTQINGALVGVAEPSFSPTDTPFWVHGYNAGLEYRW